MEHSKPGPERIVLRSTPMRRGWIAVACLLALASCGEPPGSTPPAAAPEATAPQAPADAAGPARAPRPSPDEDMSDDEFTFDDSPKPPSWDGTFAVTVVSAADRTPVTGALVRVTPAREERAETREATTGADGIAAAPRWTGLADLVVTHRGFLLTRVEEVDPSEPCEVALPPGDPLAGRVVAFDGARVDHATVVVWTAKYERLIDEGEEVYEASADGSFEIPGVAADRQVHVAAVAPGYGAVEVVSEPGTRGRPLDLVLGRGASIAGKVRASPGGDAVESAEVWLTVRGASPLQLDEEFLVPTDRHRISVAPRATTDAEGRYSVRGLPSSVFVPRARIGHGEDAVEGLGRAVDTADGAEHAGADVDVRIPCSISVRATDAAGKSLSGEEASVSLDGGWTDVDDAGRGVQSDATGAWTFRGVSPGTHHVFVDPRSGVAAWVAVEAKDGKRTTVDVRIDRGRTLRGAVRDEAGAPVAGAHVGYSGSPSPGAPSQYIDATADEGGVFVLAGLPAEAGELSAYADGFLNAELPGTTAPELPNPVVLRRAARIVLHLPESLVGKELDWGVRQAENGSSSSGEADSERIEFDRVLPGQPADVYVRRKRGPPFLRRGIVLGPGETRDLGEVAFDEGVAVEGRLVDAEGHPLRGAQIRAADWWAGGKRATTGSDGNWRLDDMAAGSAWLWVASPGLPKVLARIECREGESVEIRVPRGGVLRGRCVREGEAVEADSHVDAVPLDLDGALDVWEIRLDARGGFSEALPAGRYRVLLHSRKGWSAPATVVTIVDGAETAVDLTSAR